MTAVTVATERVRAVLAAANQADIRPANVVASNGDATSTITWTPDLSPGDTTTIGVIAKLATGSMLISPAERAALDPQVAEIRTLRTRSLAAWNALTAAQRQADQIAYLNDLTDVIRAILRDG